MVDADEFEIGTSGADAAPARSTTAASRGGSPLLGWALTAVALVLGGVALAPEQGYRTDGFPPGTAGMIAVDATVPPEEVWRAEVGPIDGLPVLQVVDGLVLASSAGTITALALADGTSLWEIPFDPWRCLIRDAIACVDGAGTEDAIVTITHLPDGDQTQVPVPRAVAATDVGADLVALVMSDDELALERHGDELRWHTALPDVPVLPNDFPYTTAPAQLQVVGSLAVPLLGSGNVVDVETGAPVDDGPIFIEHTPFGYLVSRDAGYTATLVDSSGDVIYDDLITVPADQLHDGVSIHVDASDVIISTPDGSWSAGNGRFTYPSAMVDGVLVMQHSDPGGGLGATAHDLMSGTELWSVQESLVPVLGAGSTLIAMRENTLAGIDAHTAQTLWEQPSAWPYTMAPLPDGMVVYGSDERIVRLRW